MATQDVQGIMSNVDSFLKTDDHINPKLSSDLNLNKCRVSGNVFDEQVVIVVSVHLKSGEKDHGKVFDGFIKLLFDYVKRLGAKLILCGDFNNFLPNYFLGFKNTLPESDPKMKKLRAILDLKDKDDIENLGKSALKERMDIEGNVIHKGQDGLEEFELSTTFEDPKSGSNPVKYGILTYLPTTFKTRNPWSVQMFKWDDPAKESKDGFIWNTNDFTLIPRETFKFPSNQNNINTVKFPSDHAGIRARFQVKRQGAAAAAAAAEGAQGEQGGAAATNNTFDVVTLNSGGAAFEFYSNDTEEEDNNNISVCIQNAMKNFTFEMFKSLFPDESSAGKSITKILKDTIFQREHHEGVEQIIYPNKGFGEPLNLKSLKVGGDVYTAKTEVPQAIKVNHPQFVTFHSFFIEYLRNTLSPQETPSVAPFAAAQPSGSAKKKVSEQDLDKRISVFDYLYAGKNFCGTASLTNIKKKLIKKLEAEAKRIKSIKDEAQKKFDQTQFLADEAAGAAKVAAGAAKVAAGAANKGADTPDSKEKQRADAAQKEFDAANAALMAAEKALADAVEINESIARAADHVNQIAELRKHAIKYLKKLDYNPLDNKYDKKFRLSIQTLEIVEALNEFIEFETPLLRSADPLTILQKFLSLVQPAYPPRICLKVSKVNKPVMDLYSSIKKNFLNIQTVEGNPVDIANQKLKCFYEFNMALSDMMLLYAIIHICTNGGNGWVEDGVLIKKFDKNLPVCRRNGDIVKKEGSDQNLMHDYIRLTNEFSIGSLPGETGETVTTSVFFEQKPNIPIFACVQEFEAVKFQQLTDEGPVITKLKQEGDEELIFYIDENGSLGMAGGARKIKHSRKSRSLRGGSRKSRKLVKKRNRKYSNKKRKANKKRRLSKRKNKK